MILSVELPDAFAYQMHLDGTQGQRRALEILVFDGYCAGELSQGQVGELVSISFHETEEFLKVRKAPPGLGPEEHLRGLRNLERSTSLDAGSVFRAIVAAGARAVLKKL